MQLYDFADRYLDWVEDAPNLFFISGPVMLGVAALFLFFEAERSRRRRESTRRVRWLLFGGLVFAGIVVSYAVVLAAHG